MTHYQPMPFMVDNRAVEIIYNQSRPGKCATCYHEDTTLFQFFWNVFLCPACFQFALDVNFPKPMQLDWGLIPKEYFQMAA